MHISGFGPTTSQDGLVLVLLVLPAPHPPHHPPDSALYRWPAASEVRGPKAGEEDQEGELLVQILFA